VYLFDNPVLRRELLSNLRSWRGFALLAVYNLVLAGLVYLIWPADQSLDLSVSPESSRQLMELFFLGQYVLASLAAPSFAAGAISGEKERRTYEMLLSNPLRPGAIVLGKLLAALVPPVVIVVSSLPIVMLCLPLGGMSIYEVLAAYGALLVSVATFGMIGLTASGTFTRTANATLVSYMVVLPIALFGALSWWLLRESGEARLFFATVMTPVAGALTCLVLYRWLTGRLLRPVDVGAQAHEVVDVEQEMRGAVGLVIRRDHFPDKLFAPPKRTDLLPDSANAVYEKELHSEIFGQGTRTLRFVIQGSMFLGMILMSVCLFMRPMYAAWYLCYVALFNMLVAPVFSAGSITGERERQTLDLLLTTTLSPSAVLSGKVRSGWRVSGWLTRLLLWPVLLAWVMVGYFHGRFLQMASFLVVIELVAVTTAMLATFFSVVFRKTTIALVTTYIVLAILFGMPPVVRIMVYEFFPELADPPALTWLGAFSPLSTLLAVPLEPATVGTIAWGPLFAYVLVTTMLLAGLFLATVSLFHLRWRSES
jgi:ABC-type transport system involved in multi-copper enzyme maturation permease subunit